MATSEALQPSEGLADEITQLDDAKERIEVRSRALSLHAHLRCVHSLSHVSPTPPLTSSLPP